MDTCNLSMKLEESQKKMDQWSMEFKQLISMATDDSQSQDLKKKIEGLKTSYETAVSEKEKAAAMGRDQTQVIQAQLDVLRQKTQAKEDIIALLKEELDSISKQESSLTDGADVAASKEKEKYYEDQMAMYRKWLGLEINKVKGGWLQFIFTQIDPKNPSLPFMFLLNLDGNRKYKVSDVQPAVHNMDDLVTELNASDDLYGFMHRVRRQFQNIAAAS